MQSQTRNYENIERFSDRAQNFQHQEHPYGQYVIPSTTCVSEEQLVQSLSYNQHSNTARYPISDKDKMNEIRQLSRNQYAQEQHGSVIHDDNQLNYDSSARFSSNSENSYYTHGYNNQCSMKAPYYSYNPSGYLDTNNSKLTYRNKKSGSGYKSKKNYSGFKNKISRSGCKNKNIAYGVENNTALYGHNCDISAPAYINEWQCANYNYPKNTDVYGDTRSVGSGGSTDSDSDTDSTSSTIENSESDSESYNPANNYVYHETSATENDFDQPEVEKWKMFMQKRIPHIRSDSSLLEVMESTIEYIRFLSQKASGGDSQCRDSDLLTQQLTRLRFN